LYESYSPTDALVSCLKKQY